MAKPVFKDGMLQERYDQIENKQLDKEYYNFLAYCKSHKIGVHHILKEDNGGRVRFRARAEECGYVLGMFPDIDDSVTVADPSVIRFTVRDKLKIPFGKNPTADRSKGRIPPKTIDNIKEISGFGVRMDLRGWYLFCKGRLQDIKRRIEAGETIEEIFGNLDNHKPGCANAMFLRFRDSLMSVSQACEKAMVDRKTFSRLSKSMSQEEAQKVFDKLAYESYSDYKYMYKRYWVLAREEDFRELLSMKNNRKCTMPDLLNLLIKKWKGEM